MRRKRISGFKAGLIAIAICVVAIFLGFTKGLPFRHHYTVKAVFASANQLLVGSPVHPGSPVRIAGVDVGQVTGISRGPGDTALVSMRIDSRGRPVHSDATLRIRPRLFLEGNFFVDMTAGSPSAPEIHDGGTIPLAQTAIPVGLNEVLDAFQQDTRGDLKLLVREYAKALDDGGAQALNSSFQYWPGAFRNVAIANEASRGKRAHDLSGLIADAGRTSKAIASREADLGDLVTSFDHTAAALASEREQLASSLSGLRTLEQNAPPQLTAVDRAAGPVKRFAIASTPGLRDSPATLDAAVPFLRVAGALVAPAELPALISDLRPAIRDLADLEPQLDSLFDLISPVTACVGTHALPVLNSKLDDGALSSGQPVWEEILHTAGGLTSATQNFDGNGYNTRYSFGSGPDIVSLGKDSNQQQLYSFGAIQGSRPVPPASPPPFRPDVPCASDALPDLKANAEAPANQREVGRITPTAAKTLLDALTKAARK